MLSIRNLKITHKLYAILALVLIGFTAVGLAYMQLTKAAAVFEADNNRLSVFAAGVEKTYTELVNAQRIQKNFALTGDIKLLDSFEAEMTKAREQLIILQRDAPEGVNLATVNSLEDLFAQYHSDFYGMAETRVNIGLDENSGLQGELRDAIHAVEDNLKKLDNPKLETLMLTMRRHEKDFILRKNDKYISNMDDTRAKFLSTLNATGISAATKKVFTNEMAAYKDSFNAYTTGIRDVERADAIVDSRALQIEPVLETLRSSKEAILAKAAEKISAERDTITTLFATLLISIGLVVAVVIFLFSRGVTSSLNILQNAVKRVTDGDLDARAKMTSGDELGQLGNAFDKLLDERVSTMVQAEQENERLNDSVIDLLEAVSDLSDKDLTVKVPVAEDVTGPVADAMNMMASETSRVLKDIRAIAEQVENAANTVSMQGERVIKVTSNERVIVQSTMEKLEDASKTMNQIAKLAQTCNEMAAQTSQSTSDALASVTDTTEGMNDIRETISETEKRIKRLGERSQEITGVVAIINNIAERTHVLALNASMQAAAAGDAGRGFAVVADEVQRLAESSRQSTAEIQALVSNIQTETAETMATMNKTITQVVDGTELAQRSGEQMQTTQKTTNDLAGAVEKIAQHSLKQAKMSNELREEATKIVDSTEETSKELEEQAKHTASLVDFSKRLLESVRVFKLPA